MKQFKLDVSRFESADDGNTTHYGGVFYIDNTLHHFYGNDRECSPTECIVSRLLVGHSIGVNSDGYDKLAEALDNLGYEVEGEPTVFMCCVDDEGNINIDPI